MAYKNKEIEIQLEVENSGSLRDFLEKEGQFKYEKRQIDEYFTPKKNDYTAVRPIKEWLRLRESEGKHSLNYKNWHYDEKGLSYHCDEYETEIGDAGQMKKILEAQHYISLVVVDKIRRVYYYKDYEVAIDKVKGLNDAVEVEYIGQDEKVVPKEVCEQMQKFVKSLDVGRVRINRQGYPFLLLFPKEAKWEEV